MPFSPPGYDNALALRLLERAQVVFKRLARLASLEPFSRIEHQGLVRAENDPLAVG